MGLESIGDAGIVGVLVVLILREVFSFLAKREAAASGGVDEDCDEALGTMRKIDTKLDDLSGATQAMSAILTRTDADGLPLCYTPRSLTTSLDALAKNIERLTDRVDRI